MSVAKVGKQTKAVQKISEESRKCFEFFFSQKYAVGSEDFEEQLLSLTRMAYICFDHLRGEMEEIARKTDAEDLISNKQEPVTPLVESNTSENEAIDSNQEDDLSTTVSVASDSFSDDSETSVSTTGGVQDPEATRETDSFIKRALKHVI